MEIDKEIDTPMGKVVFRGNLTEDELDYVITIGLVTMMIRGELDAVVSTADGTILSDTPEQLQWDSWYMGSPLAGHLVLL